MPPKSKFIHLDQRNQILLRPGQHITGTENVKEDRWVFDENLVEKNVKYNTGLVHIFYEVLSNAQDNYFRSIGKTPLKKIEVTFDPETQKITVWNDGNHIPTVLHEWADGEEKIKDELYEAELIFGYLNSSGNYDDKNETRMGAGLHGVGVKLTNIFSKIFTVKTQDPVNELSFSQTFYDNMERSDPPKVKSCKKAGFTEVSYIADFSRFNCEKYSQDFVSIIRKLCLDCAMITGAKVVFNGETIPVKGLLGYAKYFNSDTKTLEFKSKDSSVVVIENPNKTFRHVAFTNGVINPDGGVHVDEWCKAIFKPLLDKIKKKYTKGKASNPLKMSLKQLLDHFMIFISCNLPNPSFAGQSKARLNSPKPKCDVTESKINSMLKWDFMNDIDDTVKLQSMKDIKKLDARKQTMVNIPGLEDANKAGTAQSEKCVLFVTEGLSAKSLAVKGRGVLEKGNDYFGAMPVKGKSLNVQGKSALVISANKEIQNITKALGLRSGVDYTKPENYKTLRYGKMCIFADADYDGTHIKGLLLNIFRVLYPTLLEIDFVINLRTPIVKATVGKKIYEFYHLSDFKEWEKNNQKEQKSFKVKYYKGLGTTTDSEIADVFSEPKWVSYKKDSDAFKSIDLAFGPDVGKRKVWLREYKESDDDFKYPVESGKEIVPITDFVNKELIQFSIYDCQRSIPNVVDGFKTSQRKAIWIALKTLNTKDDYKISQLASAVANLSEYHHGEVSMEGTLIGLAHTFVGSNNVTVLEERGQFGGREYGGKDAASSRYIYTRLTEIARKIFRPEDDKILRYLEDEGKSIEPKFFVPIIPMILANGVNTGIGTGFSTHVPNYNPLDLVKWIKNWLHNENGKDATSAPPYDDLVPWYWGFTGETKVEGKTVTHYGVLEKESDGIYRVTELPVRVWLGGNDLCTGIIDTLHKLKEKKIVTKWENHGSSFKINFKIWACKNLTLKDLGLVKTETLNNLTAFGPKNNLLKYDRVQDMMREYCDVRFYYYKKRKRYLLKSLNIDLLELKSRLRFIKAVLKNVEILKQSEESLFEYFESKEYYKKDDSYRYLTDIPIRNFTEDKRDLLKKKVETTEKEIEDIEKTSETEMWIRDLDEFVVAYEKYVSYIEKIREEAVKIKKKKK